jgi:adenine phosphoribosyltransferase
MRHALGLRSMKPYLERIDTVTLGRRYDVTPVFADAQCFGELVEDLAAPFQGVQLDCVACVDALGFILGTAIARHLGIGIVPIRKGGKLPVEVNAQDFHDYSGEMKRLEVRRDAFLPEARVLLVDEWIETGAQVKAALRLIESQGGVVVGIASINMDANEDTAEISSQYRVHTVWQTDPTDSPRCP